MESFRYLESLAADFALQALDGGGAVRMRRGAVAVLDRTALLEAAGAGYGVAEAE